MVKAPNFYYCVIILILIFTLTGCELPRNSASASDLQSMGAQPTPTLASLGADANLGGEATPIPTVINPQPAAEPAKNPAEAAPPAAQPVIAITPAAASKQAIQVSVITQSVQAETFTPPISTTTTETPIIVNATSPERPDGGPVAANPPAGQASDYGQPIYTPDGTYMVQAGDTLFSLSMRYGVTIEALMRANNLMSDVIYEGQVLNIPTGETGYTPGPGYDPSMPGGGGYHTVAAGETLFSIAMMYGTSVEEMAAVNGLTYPFTIYEGQTLTIPGYGPPQPMFEGGYGQPQPSMPASGNTHVVAPGETLYSISVLYGTTPRILVALNGLANPNQIYVGQVLNLP